VNLDTSYNSHNSCRTVNNYFLDSNFSVGTAPGVKGGGWNGKLKIPFGKEKRRSNRALLCKQTSKPVGA
jgi:hypothetical protein